MDHAQANRPAGSRQRILFIAEAVTLAHVARPLALAQSLDRSRYEIFLAVEPRFSQLLGKLPFDVRAIQSISSDRFLQALAQGSPLYDAETIRAYVQEDLALIREIVPAVVVGDFRLSLSVSARLTATPYLTITNAYWSPYAHQRYPLPDLPMTRTLGVPLARLVFRLVQPFVFAYHARHLNRVRREFGLSSLGLDLRRVYTDADHTLYADVPELISTVDLPDNHSYLGSVLWSPAVKRPDWWESVPLDKPVIYVTLGSSGRSELLAVVLEALSSLPVSVLAATAGRVRPQEVPGNAFLSDYLPGEEAARRARVVICNGGSPTTQQALVAGVPVLGLASNLDQYLNMQAVTRFGAGELVRAGKADAVKIRTGAKRLLDQPAYAAAATRAAEAFGGYDAPSIFREVLSRLAPAHAAADQGRR
jgi:UDP:flavonoid glycosyltransferase YjiC (YdhE family)